VKCHPANAVHFALTRPATTILCVILKRLAQALLEKCIGYAISRAGGNVSWLILARFMEFRFAFQEDTINHASWVSQESLSVLPAGPRPMSTTKPKRLKNSSKIPLTETLSRSFGTAGFSTMNIATL
jgi:hypothetical protein